MKTKILKRIRRKTKVVIRLNQKYPSHPYDIFTNGEYDESRSTLSGAIEYAWDRIRFYGLTDEEKRVLGDRSEKNLYRKALAADESVVYSNF